MVAVVLVDQVSFLWRHCQWGCWRQWRRSALGSADLSETHVAKGIFGGAGDSLDGVGLICTPKDDLDSESILKTEGLGNPEGGTPFEYFCPARTQLIGIGGTLNSPESFLSRIFPYCAKLPEQGALATNQK